MKRLWWALSLAAIASAGYATFSIVPEQLYMRHLANTIEIHEAQRDRHDSTYKQEQQEQELRSAARIAELCFEKSDPRRRNPLVGLGFLYRKQHEYAKAEAVFRKLYTTYGDAYANDLADTLADEGCNGEAEVLYRQTLAWRERTADGPYDEEVGDALLNLAEFYRRQERWQESAALYQRSIHIQQHTLAMWGRDTRHARHNSPGEIRSYALKKIYGLKLSQTLDTYSRTLSRLNKRAEEEKARIASRQLQAQYGDRTTRALLD